MRRPSLNQLPDGKLRTVLKVFEVWPGRNGPPDAACLKIHQDIDFWLIDKSAS
jgi:hypothetical protein